MTRMARHAPWRRAGHSTMVVTELLNPMKHRIAAIVLSIAALAFRLCAADLAPERPRRRASQTHVSIHSIAPRSRSRRLIAPVGSAGRYGHYRPNFLYPEGADRRAGTGYGCDQRHVYT